MELVGIRKEEFYTISQYKITDADTLKAVKSYLLYDENNKKELKLGNVFIDFMYDNATSELMIGCVTDIKSSTWELYPDQISELFGDKYSKAKAA